MESDVYKKNQLEKLNIAIDFKDQIAKEVKKIQGEIADASKAKGKKVGGKRKKPEPVKKVSEEAAQPLI